MAIMITLWRHQNLYLNRICPQGTGERGQMGSNSTKSSYDISSETTGQFWSPTDWDRNVYLERYYTLLSPREVKNGDKLGKIVLNLKNT